MANVENWRMKYIGLPSPNTPAPMTDITVSSWLTTGFRWLARMETPRKYVPRITDMRVRVVAAFLDSGGRKAGTPLEMASTPERATAPDEKARRIRSTVTPV